MGPWWPEKVHTIFSADVLALRLQEMTMPCSVPTMNLVGYGEGVTQERKCSCSGAQSVQVKLGA